MGSATTASTFISTPRDALLESEAIGYRVYNVNGIYNAGAWLQLAVTKLSGATLLIGATNDGSLATLADLASKLTNAVNTCPELQGPDGVVVDEIGQNVYGGPALTVRARTGGYNASKVQVRLLASSRLVPNPSATMGLNYNLPDLQPRNHLYLTCGAQEISSSFNLDTTTLPDGYHELTAVAYEGSHVRCQTRIALPITVRNTGWKSALTLVDFAATNSVSGTYHIQLSSTAPNVSALRLFSNGGQVGVVSNQSNATFTLSGNLLGAGLVPFYGVVETAGGQSLRTSPQTVRFISP
jgi:hypothetical protein